LEELGGGCCCSKNGLEGMETWGGMEDVVLEEI